MIEIKKFFTALGMAIFTSSLVYLAGCMGNASFNLSKWGTEARAFVSIFWLVGFVFAFVITYLIYDDL